MRLFVMFDLPVKTADERRAATRFRKFLMQDGYDMIQLSVYCRLVKNEEAGAAHLARLQNNLPHEGAVRFLQITDRQYGAMRVLVGTRSINEKFLKTDQMLLF